MKRSAVIFVCAIMLALVGASAANAAPVNLFTLPYVYSPNSDSAPYTLPTTDDAFLNNFGSLWLGKPFNSADSFVYSGVVSQATGIYGVGAPLGSLGLNSAYKLVFDGHLKTLDSASNDLFGVVITENGYLWNGGAPVGGWTWGGQNRDGLESIDFGPAVQSIVNVTPGLNYYMNAVLITTGDTNFASWGRISDLAVDPVPEPATLTLVGAGLAWAAARRRRK